MIGYLIEGYPRELTIITTNGYFVDLNWDGSLSDKSYYTSESNAQGIAYNYQWTPKAEYGKVAYFSSVLSSSIYAPKYLDGNGFVIANQSFTNGTGVTDSGGLAYWEFGDIHSNAFELEVITRDEVGIPAVIGNLKLSFD